MAALQRFKQSLGKKSYCCNQFENGLQLVNTNQALQHKHVSLNQRLVHYLAFDIDNKNASLAFDDNDMPQPTINIINKQNGHAHYLYELSSPFPKSIKANQKIISWSAGLERGFQRRLNSDMSYAGLIIKNPAHKHWRVIEYNKSYSLNELDSYLDYEDKRFYARKEAAGLGRNCTLFDDLRYYAYRNVSKCNSYNKFRIMIFTKAHELNLFATPLPQSEIRSTANSVCKWTWNNQARFDYNPEDPFREFCGDTVEKMSAYILKFGLPYRGQLKAIVEWTGLSERTVKSFNKAYVVDMVKNR